MGERGLCSNNRTISDLAGVCRFGASLDAPERSYSGVELPWVAKPERSCNAITLMTVVAFVTTVFVRQVDVTSEVLGRPKTSAVGATSEVLDCPKPSAKGTTFPRRGGPRIRPMSSKRWRDPLSGRQSDAISLECSGAAVFGLLNQPTC